MCIFVRSAGRFLGEGCDDDEEEEEEKEDALHVDEEITTIGAIPRAHQRPIGFVQVQVASRVGILHRTEGNPIGTVWENGDGRYEFCWGHATTHALRQSWETRTRLSQRANETGGKRGGE